MINNRPKSAVNFTCGPRTELHVLKKFIIATIFARQPFAILPSWLDACLPILGPGFESRILKFEEVSADDAT